MLHFIQSNRLEKLFERLCQILADSPADPFIPVEIIVQNPGMGKWMSQQMALLTGIAANLRFPLPARFIWQVFASQLELDEEKRDFDRSILHWRILDELSGSLPDKFYSEMKRYLSDDHDGRKAFHLAGKIADLFDQYLVYRPEMILSWESGGEAGWQGELWRKLTDTTKQHRAGYIDQFLQKANKGYLNPKTLPQQVYIFGISSLAPAYLEVIRAISSVVEVHLFHMSPCRDYWSDILSDAEVARNRKVSAQKSPHAEDEYFFGGNPLLASLGKVGRDFVSLIHQLNGDEEEHYMEPESTSMLATLQRDILDLCDHSAPNAEKIIASDDDCSVQLHSCHSRMREVQVLHDRLLEMFEKEPGLKPGDILVMAPTIEEYASAVCSVFDGAPQEMFIPWSLADRSVRGENRLADTFLSAFELCRGRFSAPEVISFLENEAVMRRFRIDEEGLATIRRWVDESGIRWGLDSEHRHEFSPEIHEVHSWSFGIDRLLMAYFTGELDEEVHSIAPIGSMTGFNAILLGRFVSFLNHLRTTRDQLLNERNPSDWTDQLLALLDGFFDPGSIDEDQQALLQIRETICSLNDNTKLAGFNRKLNISVIRAYLLEALANPSSGQAFLSGRVTFCNMVPMRSVPFRVICLLGLNDADYPRKQTVAGFDLMASQPRLGDRNRRDDDRFLFLEALLSAREIFYVSWLGRNQLDNSIRPPSVVVSELLDYMERSMASSSGDPLTQNELIVNHPLQPFSSKCFDGSPATESFARQWMPSSEVQAKTLFLDHPLPEPDEGWKTVNLDEFLQFWSHPVRFFLQRRLGMQVYESDDLLEESEIFQPDHLDKYILTDRLIHARLKDQESNINYSLLNAEGKLPHGGFGRNYYEDLVKSTDTILPDILSFYSDRNDPLEVDISVEEFQIKGWLTNLYEYGCVRFRPAKIKGKDLVKLWIEHLVYNVVDGDKEACRSVHIGLDMKVDFRPVVDPTAELKNLLDLYWQGLSIPLHFFPETSKAWFNPGKDTRSDYKAKQEWYGGFKRRGESEGLEYQIALQGIEPLDNTFERLAEEVYTSIFDHLESNNA